MDPLRIELSRLLRQAQNQSTSQKAINDIYAFKKRNPDYNIDSVLDEQSKYIALFVKRKLEMMAWNEGEPERALTDEHRPLSPGLCPIMSGET